MNSSAFYPNVLRYRFYSRGNINRRNRFFSHPLALDSGVVIYYVRLPVIETGETLKLMVVPHRSKTPAKKTPAAPPAASFRKRFDELERRRAALIARLESMGDKVAVHPVYKRALTLLNATFRKASLAQRVAVLQAATWLVDLLENIAFFG
jgi:hypothetical protein